MELLKLCMLLTILQNKNAIIWLWLTIVEREGLETAHKQKYQSVVDWTHVHQEQLTLSRAIGIQDYTNTKISGYIYLIWYFKNKCISLL